MQTKQIRKQRGFTLVELLVVIGIIAALAAVVIPNVARFVGSGDQAANETELATVQAAIDLYMADNALVDVAAAATTDLWDFELVVGQGDVYPDYLRQVQTKCEYSVLTTGIALQTAGTCS